MRLSTFGRTALAAAAIGGAAAALAVSASAQDDERFVRNTDASGKACFRVDRVEGFAPVRFGEGIDGVNLRVRNDVYQMKFATPCPEIREATRVAVDSRQPVYVCTGADADIVAYSTIAPAQRCKVSGLRKVEPSEVASLPAAEKP